METVKILIVEDEFVTANDFSEKLQTWGYHTFMAATSDEALNSIQKHHPDLVLLDIHLNNSDMDGIQVAEEINHTKPVPIIFITARLDDDTFQRALQQNPISYITKPIRDRDLRNAIKIAIANFANIKGGSNHAKPDDRHFLLQDNIFIKVNTTFKKIHVPDIKWVQASGSYINLVTVQNEYRNLVNNLSKFNGQVNHSLLLKVHRSWIVNLAKVDGINQGDHTLFIGEKEIPIGKTYYRQVMNYFQL